MTIKRLRDDHVRRNTCVAVAIRVAEGSIVDEPPRTTNNSGAAESGDSGNPAANAQDSVHMLERTAEVDVVALAPSPTTQNTSVASRMD